MIRVVTILTLLALLDSPAMAQAEDAAGTLDRAVGTIVAQVGKQLQRRVEPHVAIDPLDGPPGGRVVETLLAKKLSRIAVGRRPDGTKVFVTVRNDATWKLRPTISRESEPGPLTGVIQVTLAGDQPEQAETFTARFDDPRDLIRVFSPSAVEFRPGRPEEAQPLGRPVSTSHKMDDARRLAAALGQPRVMADDGRRFVSPSWYSPYMVQVLVRRGPGCFDPAWVQPRHGRAWVHVPAGSTFAVRIVNCAHLPVGAEISVNGQRGVVLVDRNSSIIPGLHVAEEAGTWRAFQLAPRDVRFPPGRKNTERQAAAVITVTFHSAWTPHQSPPRDQAARENTLTRLPAETSPGVFVSQPCFLGDLRAAVSVLVRSRPEITSSYCPSPAGRGKGEGQESGKLFPDGSLVPFCRKGPATKETLCCL